MKTSKYYAGNAAARAKKAEYDTEYHSTRERKKYRAELNKKNRDAGTYGNGDGKDYDHDGASLLPALNLLANYGCAFSDNSDECQYTPATAEYDNRLYAFDKLSLSAQNIKAALCMNYPVVIAVSSYSDGWHVSKNLISGVWNGN